MCVYVWCVCVPSAVPLSGSRVKMNYSVLPSGSEDHRRACAGGATKWTPRPAHTCAAIRLLAHGGELCPCDLTRLTVSRSSPLKAAYIAYPDRLAPCAGYGTTCAWNKRFKGKGAWQWCSFMGYWKTPITALRLDQYDAQCWKEDKTGLKILRHKIFKSSQVNY